MYKIITIDGPASSGKTSLAKHICNILNFKLLDSGFLYRMIATYYDLFFKDKPIDLFLKHVKDIEVGYKSKDRIIKFYIKNAVNELISSERTAKSASILSVNPEVRSWVDKNLIKVSEGENIVAVGRDMGSNVFSGADIKIFLDSSVEVRARRRFEEQKAIGIDDSYEFVLRKISKRDKLDREKADGKLVIPKDAIIINNSNMNEQETLATALSLINKKGIKNEFKKS